MNINFNIYGYIAGLNQKSLIFMFRAESKLFRHFSKVMLNMTLNHTIQYGYGF